MDAYDIYQRIKTLWSVNCDKQSGVLTHDLKEMKVLVYTQDGYREIVDLRYDENLKSIILIKDEE
jgi:myo-inositol-hexaphosphate 3-phosphohydrolase